MSRDGGLRELLRDPESVVRSGPVWIEKDWRGEGVTDQFLGAADTYHDRYFKNEYWTFLVDRAMTLAGVARESAYRVLDIGSGSGNTVLPLLEMLPNSTVVASDISPQLLHILARNLPSKEAELACFDLHNDLFKDDAFDLVVGGAVLHHMIDPRAALANVVKWVKPGGRIILFEPFEAGAHILACLQTMIVDRLEGRPGDHARLIGFHRAIIRDIEARLGVPDVKPWTAGLDDKWYFSFDYLRRLAAGLGCSSIAFFPLSDDTSNIYRDTLNGLLQVSGNGDLVFPDDILELIARFDRAFPPDLKRELTPEGIVIMTCG